MPEYLPEGFVPPVYDMDRVFIILVTLIFLSFSTLSVFPLSADGGDFFFALFGGLAWYAIGKYAHTEWQIKQETKELDDLG